MYRLGAYLDADWRLTPNKMAIHRTWHIQREIVGRLLILSLYLSLYKHLHCTSRKPPSYSVQYIDLVFIAIHRQTL